MLNKKIKGLFELLLFVLAILFFSYLVQSNLVFLENLISNDILGIAVYSFLEILSIVVAPVTTLPLIFIASNLWGWVLTGIINVVSWTIGSIIAFFIARRYGIDIIKKFVSIEKVYEIQNKIPKKHLFWSVVFLRIVIPADVLSYALGLFTKMTKRNYILSTIIGITPAAFIYSYFGTFPFVYQIVLLLVVGIIILSGWITRMTCKKCVEFVKEKFAPGETSFSKEH